MIGQKRFFRALVCTLLLFIVGILTVSCNFDSPTKDIPTPEASKTVQQCPPTIQYGSQGQWVKTLQLQLNDLGVRDQEGKILQVDSKFGARTEYAVKSFQTQHNLQADGVVGPKTWAALDHC